MPAGRMLMEEFHYAGGLPAALRSVKEHVHLDAVTVAGQTIGDAIEQVDWVDEAVIRPAHDPVRRQGGIAVLHGNIAPGGCVIKPAAATDALMQHRGPAVVFDGVADMRARIDDPDLDVDETSVLVLRGCGPAGFPGMAEVGNMQLPRKLLEKGVTDMVRITDGRMSGTAFGTVVLHVSPESARGGPLAAIRDGDMIALDVAARTITLEIDDAELARRMEDVRPWDAAMESGWQRIYADNVLQANEGADLGVLQGRRGNEPPFK
jgi:dihydroxy-acid dehydratase